MAETKFDICSRALGKIDAETINSFADGTKESEQSALHYEAEKKTLLTLRAWNANTFDFKMSRDVVAPITTQYKYRYTIPSDWLRTINVSDSSGRSVPYRQQGRKIYTDEPEAYIRYQADLDESDFPPYLAQALVARMANILAEPLVGEAELNQKTYAEAQQALTDAIRIDAQENPPIQLVSAANSGWVRVRGAG